MSMMNSAIPAGCWDLDLASGMLALCPHSRTMFGLSPGSTDRLKESEWASRLHPDDLPAVRRALTASLVHRAPYAERFRTLHPDGRIQMVLGIGRPLVSGGEFTRFVGWNFDVVETGELAADWISAHPEAVGGEHRISLPRSNAQIVVAPETEPPSPALLERAESILRVRRARERLLGRAVIGEPAFDLLLCLYLQSGQKGSSVSSLARSAGIAYSSAMRWIRYLEDKGLVERTDSRSDRRAICVQLTPSGRAVLNELFSLR
jgi:DNA-binding MarR family transcriptional regulator